MDNQQKEQIQRMRLVGDSYAQISLAVGLPVGTIKAYCSRNSIKAADDAQPGCAYCGMPLEQKSKQKPRRFCSDACRQSWWKGNRDKRKSTGSQHVCAHCGTLDTLSLSFVKIRSLDGLKDSNRLTCLYLTRCRGLSDISGIRQVKSTLRALRMQDCNSIRDFSVMAELDHLELLAINGTGSIGDIQFIGNMPSLKTLILGIKVLDGDLTPCLSLEHATCLRSYKHYNLSDKNLPKGMFAHGNESIPEWRRLE